MADKTEIPPRLVEEDLSIADAEIGGLARYTDQKGKIRAAVVMFLLTDGDDVRPVLRVFIPAAPGMPGMPKAGIIYPVSQQDYEVYGPLLDEDESVVNTWRPAV